MSSDQFLSILKKFGPPVFKYLKKYWKKRQGRKNQQNNNDDDQQQQYYQQNQQQQQQFQQYQQPQQTSPYGGPPPQQHHQQYPNHQQQSAWGNQTSGGAATSFYGGGEPSKPSPSQHSPSHSPTYNQDQVNHENPHYTELRNKAKEEGDLMHRAFEAASKAHDSGDGARAKELSNEGHKHQQLMHEYNENAADWVYNANNQGRDASEIDLHGLFVQEAIDRTERAIVRAKQQGLSQLRIIVGKGNHSQQHVAKIKPAIVELMDKHDLDADLDSQNSGVLIVQLHSDVPAAQRNTRGFANKIAERDDCVLM